MSSLKDEDVSAGSDDGARGGVGAGPAAVVSAARMAAADIALITDVDQIITHVSESFTAMTGYEEADLLGLNCRVLQGAGTDPDTRARMRDVIASREVFEGEVLNYRKDGSAFWTALRIIPMRVGDSRAVTHFVSVQRDITNRVALLKQVQDQALHDHVTGLPNRLAAEQTVADIVRRTPHQHQVRTQDRGLVDAVCLIDLDDFRIVNNTLGHAAGDAVLQQWATRISSRLREGDVLARMGGDEFLLILRNVTRATSEKDLRKLLARLHEVTEQPFLVDGQQIRIGMSMGIALVPENGTDSRTILRHADEALYTAKNRHQHGAPWWVIDTHADIRASSTLLGRDHSGAGIAGSRRVEASGEAGTTCYQQAVRSGDILVHFQPLVDLRSGSVILFEALARLTLPTGRVASPDEFLPHLDDDDLHVLFAHVLDQGLGLIAAWDREGVRPNVSVNLPPEILHDPTLPELVEGSLRDHGVEPGGLGLELLESHTESLESQRVALQDLARLGVRLAMDDLGSGHSSLQRLSSFPFHAIKLDRGLFEYAYDRPVETLSIMATLIQMGRDLGMTVVIEGLEYESLTEAAAILGAPLGQGYYFAEPMTAEDCGPWFDSFELDLHPSEIRTPLGALAYHWQFARLSAPHPLGVRNCPLSRFIQATATEGITGADGEAEVESWHALQHSSHGMHPASSRLLIHWLTQRIATPIPAPAD